MTQWPQRVYLFICWPDVVTTCRLNAQPGWCSPGEDPAAACFR